MEIQNLDSRQSIRKQDFIWKTGQCNFSFTILIHGGIIERMFGNFMFWQKNNIWELDNEIVINFLNTKKCSWIDILFIGSEWHDD